MPVKPAHESPFPSLDRLWLTTPRIPVTLLLIGANVLVFVAMLGFGAGFWYAPNAVQLAWGANFAPATADGEWWRLGTAMFLHFGVVHLVTNMLALADGGRFVERMYGHGRFASIYCASGVVGNLLSLIVQGDGAVSGGASGAIFGIYGALLVYLALQRRHMQPRDFRWLFGGAAVFSAFAIVFGILVPGIDNAAHIGGLLTGVLGGLALAPATSGYSPRRGLVRRVAAGVLIAAVTGLASSIPEPRYRWREEQQAQGRINEFLVEDRQISSSWNAIMEDGRAGRESVDRLAGRLKTEVAGKYARTFEQLSALHLDPAAPSAPALEFVRKYAERRRDASHQLAEGLRQDDGRKIREALETVAKTRPSAVVGDLTPGK